MVRGEGASAHGASTAPRWWQRALPVTATVSVAALAVLHLAGTQEQVALSTSRADQQFAELLLTSAPQLACGDTARVGFDVVSHFDVPRRLTWVLGVERAGSRAGQVRAREGFTIRPGGTRTFRTVTSVPEGDYHVTVRLVGRPEQLRLHCKGGRG